MAIISAGRLQWKRKLEVGQNMIKETEYFALVQLFLSSSSLTLSLSRDSWDAVVAIPQTSSILINRIYLQSRCLMNNSTTSSGQNIDFLNAGVDILVMNHLETREIRCLLPALNFIFSQLFRRRLCFPFTSRSSSMSHIRKSFFYYLLFKYNPLRSDNTTADRNCIQSCSGTLFIIWRTRDNIIALASWQAQIQWLQIADCHINYFHIRNVNRGGRTHGE